MAIQKKQPDKNENAAGKTGPGSDSGEPAGKPITVHSYSGYKRDESPRSFELDGKKLTVLRVVKTWQEEAAQGRHRKTVFRVRTHDGKIYDIARDQGTGDWTLEPRRERK